ncbi:MAG: glycerophosphodiester phosphodiesterase family protein, partial [Spirochaetales bacterium]|nr:glycerophosphodiester phosphodiesterase family protein [Spirochaetales bacterium]
MSRVYLSLILIIPFVLSSCGSYKPEIIAHRGASGIEVQNTIEAVQAAIDLKSDAIEIDIWKTADDSLVVFHDRNTGRLSEDTLEIPESTFQE